MSVERTGRVPNYHQKEALAVGVGMAGDGVGGGMDRGW